MPEESVVLGDWDVLPARLADTAKNATVLVVLDLLSFPFESLSGQALNVPLVLVLPEGDTGFFSTVFETVFGDLGFYDRVATGDTAVWEALRREYHWAADQRVVVGGADPASVAAEVMRHVSGEDARAEKAAQRAREAALRPRFAAAGDADPEENPTDVLQVGAGDGRWAGVFNPANARFSGVDESRDAVALARRNFPESRFEKLDGLSLPHEDEDFDLVFSAGVLGQHPVPEKRALISEMWRVARPGGRLLFLEDFVSGEESAPHTVSINAFRTLLMEATAGQVVLEHAESVRYPGEDVVRGGVLGLSRLGVPRRW